MMKPQRFVLLILLSTNTAALEPEHVWRYPCDVFLPGACTRMPADATLTYSVPADFGMYKMMNAAGPILSIYTGLSPTPKPGERPAVLLNSSGVMLSGYLRKEMDALRLDIYIERSQSGTQTTHIFGYLSPSGQDAFGEFIAGIRPCISSKSGVIKCKKEEEWGTRLAALVNLK